MDENPIMVRNADTEDLDVLVGLLKQLFLIEKDFNFDGEKNRRGMALMLDGCGKHRAVKVAVHNTEIVGMCTAQTRISTATGRITAVLEDLVVDADHRGRAIGKSLLHAIEQWAQQRGITHLQLLADKNNGPAMTFYKHLKWQQTDLVCLTREI
ncbi:acetyltransferase (GNAT family protein) [Desulforapulum autotrophicum HRM2]|uniref:Acetyltransferase (GNAT family protein) n=1 Tax=Desulforapulum autotrophicum (strain ATCC 43914 / DSM 3382 / VKM B-1955 / HRM2) TaxID=177437 RepID=C0QL14_DESAH|nr:GNAT family N-acetyltransferase [Desulforapulum autotrophicum]ACN14100.1 acetyltransferase (GNAT family protein) [Desulforapulum autotrophicum HRM2]